MTDEITGTRILHLGGGWTLAMVPVLHDVEGVTLVLQIVNPHGRAVGERRMAVPLWASQRAMVGK